MIFDEMYLQRSQEYSGGEMIGCDDERELYKGIVCFMIVDLKKSIPYVIKSSPETNTNAKWLKTELLDSLEILSNCGFRVRAIVCENHPSNVSSFKKLRTCQPNSGWIIFAIQVQKILPLLRRCPFTKKGP